MEPVPELTDDQKRIGAYLLTGNSPVDLIQLVLTGSLPSQDELIQELTEQERILSTETGTTFNYLELFESLSQFYPNHEPIWS